MADQPTNLSIDDLAGKIKAKYPEYKDVDNQSLVQKIVAKYPEYASALSPEASQVAQLPSAATQAHASQPQFGDPNAKMSQSQLGEAGPGQMPTVATLAEGSIPGAFAAKHPVQAAATVPGALLGAAAAPAGILGAAATGAAGAGMGTQVTQALSGQNPLTPQALQETGGNTAVGGAVGLAAGALSPLAKWIGASKSSGASMLQAASDKAGSAPVALSPESDQILDKIVRQSKLGGTVPKAISDLMDRVGQYTQSNQPLTYDDARTLQSNISQLSANEKMALKGELRYLLPQFAKSFGQDVASAADQAGVGELHRAGMQQYAQASGKADTLDTGKDIAGKAAKLVAGSTLAAGGFEGARELLKRFGVVH